MAKAKQFELRFPTAGVARWSGFHDSARLGPPYAAPWAANVRPEDPLASRIRGGSRPGLTLYADDLRGSTIDAILSVPIGTSSGVASKLAVVADNVLGVFDGGVYTAPTGDLLTEAGVEITTEADVNILIDTGGVPGACFLCSRGQVVYAVASAGIISLDLVTGEVGALTATAGTVPTGMTLGCVYRDRLVVAGADNAVYMSRQGDFADWDFGADVEDSGRAVAFQLGEAAEHGALCTAVVPFKDASLLLATEYGLWVVQGDPAATGTLRNVSRGVGIIGSTAWCIVQDARLGDQFVKNGIVFLAPDGLYMIASSGDGLKPLSKDKVPEELLNLAGMTVSMVYSPDERGAYIFPTFAVNRHIAAEVDNRLTGVDLLLFSAFDGAAGTATWSTTCWAEDLDFTGVSYWNTTPNHRAATLISPRHVLLATHHSIVAGNTLSFWDSDGNLVTRRLDAVTRGPPHVPPTLDPDIDIGYLDADMPDGWTFYKVLPDNYNDYLSSWSPYYGLADKPVICLDKERKALVHEVKDAHESAYVTRQIPSGDRFAYYELLVTDDSSYPTFLVIDGELILLGAHYGEWQWGPIDSNCTTYIAAINRTMEDQASGNTIYQLTEYDLAALMASQPATHSWFYDLARNGFWPVSMKVTHQPLAAAWHDGKVILAGQDGNLRYIGGDDDYDFLGNKDIETHLLIGPLRAAAPGTFGRLMNLRASIAASSGAVRWRIVTGETAEEACENGKLAIEAFQAGNSYSTYVSATGGLVAGRNGIAYPRTRAEWFVVWLESTAKWGYETMMIETEQSGKVR